MKFSLPLLLLQVLSAPVPTQNPPDLPADTVVAVVDGKNLTVADINKLQRALPPNLQQNYNSNRKEFIRQYALLMRLAGMAEKAKMDQQSPHKERLEFARAQILWQAQVDKAHQDIDVSLEDQKKFYESNKDRYSQVQVKIIYLPFVKDPQAAPAGADGKKSMSEDEARKKAEELVRQIRGGADFVKLVKEHSQDATSAAKDGDFGTIRRSDNLPKPVLDAVFALKQGEVSDPVEQPNGFYIFRAEQIEVRPFDAVRNDIYNEIKSARFQKWFESVRDSIDVKFLQDAFWESAKPAAAPAGEAKK